MKSVVRRSIALLDGVQVLRVDEPKLLSSDSGEAPALRFRERAQVVGVLP